MFENKQARLYFIGYLMMITPFIFTKVATLQDFGTAHPYPTLLYFLTALILFFYGHFWLLLHSYRKVKAGDKNQKLYIMILLTTGLMPALSLPLYMYVHFYREE